MYRAIFLLIFSGLIFLFPLFLSAQDNFLPGYIVSREGDTVSGLVEYLDWKINPDNIYFKENKEKVARLLTPQDITSFGFSGFIYRSKTVKVSELPRSNSNASYLTVPESKISAKFLTLVVESRVSLFQYIDELDIDHYYIEITGDTLDELIHYKYRAVENGKDVVKTNNRYTGQLTYYLRSCEEVRKSIQEVRYDIEDLSDLFIRFNHCNGDSITYQLDLNDQMPSQRRRSRLKIGVSAGMTFSRLNFHGHSGLPYLDNTSFPGSLNPAFGLLLSIEPANARGKWSVVTDVIVRGYRTSTSYLFRYSDEWTRNYQVELGGTYITVNPMWRYYFLTGKVRPYMNAGLYMGSIVSRTNTLITEEDYYGDVSTRTSFAVSSGMIDFGITAGAGVCIRKFSIDLRYNLGGFNNWDADSNLQVIGLLAGYTFN